MQIWMTLVIALQILSALVMIGLVLIQHGKGADMGASFGSGSAGSLFGATGSANFLSRSTAVCAFVFFASTLGLALMSNAGGRAAGGGSVLDRPVEAASAAGAIGTPGTSVIPAAIPTAPAAAPAAGSAPASVSVPVPAAASAALAIPKP